jgi:hypothetical protein
MRGGGLVDGGVKGMDCKEREGLWDGGQISLFRFRSSRRGVHSATSSVPQRHTDGRMD